MNKLINIHIIGEKTFTTESICKDIMNTCPVNINHYEEDNVFSLKPNERNDIFIFSIKSFNLIFAGTTYLRLKFPLSTISSVHSNRPSNNESIFLYKAGVDFIASEDELPALLSKRLISANEKYRHLEQSLIERENISFLNDAKCILYKGKYVKLTPTQFKILQMIANEDGNVMSRCKIANACKFTDEQIRNVDVQLHYIRNKLKNIGLELKIKIGAGYFIEKSKISA